MAYPKKGECRNTGRTRFKKDCVSLNKGKKASVETCLRQSESHKGQVAWNKGKRTPLSVRRKQSEAKKGPKHPKWKGGVTPLADKLRRIPEYKEWKYAVSKRDDRTCQECGLRSSSNHVHHIKPFSKLLLEFLQKYNQFSPLEDIDTLVRLSYTHEPFWDLDNGYVLCKNCHEKTYSDVD